MGTTNDELLAGLNKSIGPLRGEMEKLETIRRSAWAITLLLPGSLVS
jgi:hypothetical protein